ncbi:MAG: ATP-binding cassette domain-containing protein [Synergistaceae bacterium]|nr:ATP-binding cassette domain-containing protein [Synergistaceae bacterium]
MSAQKNRNNDTPLIEVKSVSFTYDAKNTGRALNRVSFFVAAGERVAILGHNGSGKSTLAKILAGLQSPTEGVCLVKGKDIEFMDFRELRRTVGIVFQDPENQIVAAMVEDDAAFAPENQGLPSGEIQARVDSVLERVNLTHKQGASVSALSGGEKQRLALAGVLAASPECIILDEATAMLDAISRHRIESVLRELHAAGMTIIQITHQIEAENFDDIERVIVLSHGSVKWEGRTRDFWDMSEELGFELPEEFKFRRYCEAHGLNFPDSFINSLPKAELAHHDYSAHPAKFELKGLSFRYSEENYALRDMNAEIFSGEWLSIIGRTGSGKSTLVQHLNALYKIQEGRIIFEGSDIPQKGEGVYTLRQKVGLVFQHPEDQLFSPTVREELAFAPKNAGFRGQELEEAVLYGLECSGLSREFLDRSPIALSGGERRLVAIASVLSARPECVVLDEPLAGLDASYQRKILAMLGRLRDEGRTIITILHDLKTALNFSDRILILRDGACVREGRPQEVIDTLMNTLEPETWPDVMRISAAIRRLNPSFPLLYNYQELITCI